MRSLEQVQDALKIIRSASAVVEYTDDPVIINRMMGVIFRASDLALDAMNNIFMDKQVRQEILRGMV